ncbi:hypothetical protein PR048_026967 [Dryococelus australis]|uniref:Uncharacterized protein n=1 Tax=Dryococelus australis TaxID=614101 RepID=A0ABQ9GMT2_9NEOP|nr:hypothetical protein PR048_026967 [Dryococelus australis]
MVCGAVADPLPSPPSESSPCSVEQDEMPPAVDGRKAHSLDQGLGAGDAAEVTEAAEQSADYESCPPDAHQHHVVVAPAASYAAVPQTMGPAYHAQYQQVVRPGQLRPYRGVRPVWRLQVPRFAQQPYVPQQDAFPLPPAVVNTGQPPTVQVPLVAEVPVPAPGPVPISVPTATAVVADHSAKKQRGAYSNLFLL